MTDVNKAMETIGQQARNAAIELARSNTNEKNAALENIAIALEDKSSFLLSENKKDLVVGEKNGLDDALLDRLALNQDRVDSMIEGIRQVASLPDPIGEISDLKYQPSGIQVGKMRVPLGVVGIIYESRPNVTADAAALCLKSGNAAVLRGGSEAIHSNKAIANCIRQGLVASEFPEASVQVLEITDRAAVGRMITMPEYIDVIIPRGGKGLIERVSKEARVPVIKHLDGICHVYIDEYADFDKAVSIAYNAKAQRYGTCNTMETLLVAKPMAREILPVLASNYEEEGVEMRGCELTQDYITQAKPATEEDWATEYLAPVISIKVVSGIDEAIEHIQKYSSSHTDAIVTEYYTNARRFIAEVDSSSVIVNASTRFADGFEYGLGAEIGISTDKFHVRGPVGLEGLTSQKYVVFGDGQIRI